MHAPSLIDARHPNGVIIRLYDTAGSTILEQRLLIDEFDDDNMVDELAALAADVGNNQLWAGKHAVTLAGYDGDTGELMSTYTVAK